MPGTPGNGRRGSPVTGIGDSPIKVPSPPTREGRGEGKAVREVSVLVVASCCEVTFLLGPVTVHGSTKRKPLMNADKR